MAMKTAETRTPHIQFSHAGVNVKDLDRMVDFYTRVLGFTVTDQGYIDSLGVTLAFLSMDPMEHHQFALCTNRPEDVPPDPKQPWFGGVLNQVSFRLETLDDLRIMRDRVVAEGCEIMIGTHGNAWSVYTKDPEGNTIELFVDTPWFVDQPYLEPYDLDASDEEIMRTTEELVREEPSFMTHREWREKAAASMHRDLVARPYQTDA